MAKPSANMVLRTVYLPLELDRELRQFAFSYEISKGELMRDLIREGLQVREATKGKSLAKRLAERLAVGTGEEKMPAGVLPQKASVVRPRASTAHDEFVTVFARGKVPAGSAAVPAAAQKTKKKVKPVATRRTVASTGTVGKAAAKAA